GDAESGEGARVWRGVKADQVAGFIAGLQYPSLSAGAGGEQLASFIRKQVTKIPPELTSWTVVLASNSQIKARSVTIAGHEIGLLVRNPESRTDYTYRLNKANIVSPVDEGRDFEGLKFDRQWFDAICWKADLVEDREWLE